ncbi:MAG: hypothetical protein ACI8PZ_004014 [Myxococcota bacterium]|jgi:hypothetical protein
MRRPPHIADPCHADWSAMTGDDRRRFCVECTQHVHDLSAMSEPEAHDLLDALDEGRLCVRYAVRPDGRMQHRPILARAAFTAALGASLLAMPAAASVQAEPASGTVLDRLHDLVDKARDWLDGAPLQTEPAVDLDQLETCPRDADPATEEPIRTQGAVLISSMLGRRPRAPTPAAPPATLPDLGNRGRPALPPMVKGEVAAPRE